MNEIEKTLEKRVQFHFYQKSFEKINLGQLIKESLEEDFKTISLHLLTSSQSVIFINVMHFIIEYYFVSLFKELIQSEGIKHIKAKLLTDSQILEEFFEDYIREQEISLMLSPFQNFSTLVNESD